jgi:hypothetical protein
MDLAVEAQRRIEADDRLDLVTPAALGIVTFRRRAEPGESAEDCDRRNRSIVRSIADGGDVLLTSTVLRGRYAIRLCILNHTSGPADVAAAIEAVANAMPASSADAPARPERASVQARLHADGTAAGISAGELRAIGSFASITDDEAVRFLGTGRREHADTGDRITERWALARTFYLVRSGRLSVRVGDHEVNILSPGDHLGEIAAMDWGRDFSYGRTATVEALEPTELIAFPAAALRELMIENPEIDRAIRRIAQERLGSR